MERNYIKQTIGLYLTNLFLLLLFTSCASIPKEAPLLSQELGMQIQDLENSHLSLVRLYFQNERRQVREFIDEKWLPVYANNFFENKEIREVWDRVVASENASDRLEFIVRTAPVLQQEINNKYQELIEPLDLLETELSTAVKTKYSDVKSINNAVTSYLHSASDVEQNRQRYLDMIGFEDEKIGTAINKVENITTELTGKAMHIDGKLQDFEQQFSSYKDKINQLIHNL